MGTITDKTGEAAPKHEIEEDKLRLEAEDKLRLEAEEG